MHSTFETDITGLDTTTELYCVLGNPVTHSKSPLLHNLAFQTHGINAVYLAFAPRDIGKAVSAIRTLSIRGASITLPFKESVIPFLDRVDDTAGNIGAVNTIVNKNGVLTGYNTDAEAVADSLVPLGIAGKNVLILGAGGAARAAAFAITSKGGKVFVSNRTVSRGKALARSVNGSFLELSRIMEMDWEPHVIINATSLGMKPNENVLPFPGEFLLPEMIVMDSVYTPVNTCLVQTARKKGCHVVDGLSMFVAQAAAQFFLWTGIVPDTELMRKAMIQEKT